MKNEVEIRIAIGLKEGYEHMPGAKGLMWYAKEHRAVITPGSEVEKARIRMKMQYRPGLETLPDYPNDRNAIIPVILSLPKEKRAQFIHILAFDILKLCAVGEDYWMDTESDCFAILTATPLQLCEAFLRLHNEWE